MFWTRSQKVKAALVVLAGILLIAVSSLHGQREATVVRIGYFPNITHAQALIGRAGGQFENAFGAGIRVDWKAFSAGPSAIEAIFAGAIDIAYLGPGPTAIGYIRSEGQALRLIAGASSGGASLVVRRGAKIEKASDFHGKRVATPQLGNTQDIALRAWLTANGMKPRGRGGDIEVIPTANPNQLVLFLKGQLDAAWAPEPWASLLVHQGGGRFFLDERDLWPHRQFAITNVIASTKFLKEHPDLVKIFLRTHVELTDWIVKDPEQTKQILNRQLRKETGEVLPPQVLDDAFSRMQVTCDPIRSSLEKSTQQAFDEGLLGRRRPDLSGLYDLTLLNEVLLEKKARPIQ
jgi:NitT/TauT family transport system substrate-binding protein